MILYREHRGSLDESMDTQVNFGSIRDLRTHIYTTQKKNVLVKEYCLIPDRRTGWSDTKAVVWIGDSGEELGVIGFCTEV